MKTKQDVFDEIVGEYHRTLSPLNYQNVCKAMDVYAEQMAIGFAEWLSKHKLDFQPATPDGSWIGVNMKTYSSAELFEEYIKKIKT